MWKVPGTLWKLHRCANGPLRAGVAIAVSDDIFKDGPRWGGVFSFDEGSGYDPPRKRVS